MRRYHLHAHWGQSLQGIFRERQMVLFGTTPQSAVQDIIKEVGWGKPVSSLNTRTGSWALICTSLPFTSTLKSLYFVLFSCLCLCLLMLISSCFRVYAFQRPGPLLVPEALCSLSQLLGFFFLIFWILL